MENIDLKIEVVKIHDVHEIIYLESVGVFTNVYRCNGEKELIQENITDIQRQLPSNKFCRIHDLYIINADYIKKLKENLSKYVLLKDELEIIISPTRYHDLLQFLKFQYEI